jgi:MFS family permease
VRALRVFWGFLSSRVGFKVLFFAAALMNIAAFVMIMATDSEVIYIVFYTVNSISLGGLMVIFPNVSLLIFGKKIGESVYSYYWIAFSLGNFFQFLITLVLTNNPTTSDDYGEVLFFFTLCVIAALVVCSREKLQGPWRNSLDLVEFRRKNRNYTA